MTFYESKVIEGACQPLMERGAVGQVDAVIADPPYGTTYASWDVHLALMEWWAAVAKVLRPGGAVVLTASQPFTSALVMSNPSQFRCEWIWNKANAANFPNAKKQPLKVHESVLVFCAGQPVYNPQMTVGRPNNSTGKSKVQHSATRKLTQRPPDKLDGLKYPRSILDFPKHSSQGGLHPTQKPVDLMRYLIRTYTNPGDVVLDCFAGSGTTGEAAILEGRRSVLIEKEPEFAAVCRKRTALVYCDVTLR